MIFVTVANSGLHGTMVGQFPFHWRVVRVLEDTHIRTAVTQIMGVRSFGLADIEGVCSAAFGKHILEIWGDNSAGYLIGK